MRVEFTGPKGNIARVPIPQSFLSMDPDIEKIIQQFEADSLAQFQVHDEQRRGNEAVHHIKVLPNVVEIWDYKSSEMYHSILKPKIMLSQESPTAFVITTDSGRELSYTSGSLLERDLIALVIRRFCP